MRTDDNRRKARDRVAVHQEDNVEADPSNGADRAPGVERAPTWPGAMWRGVARAVASHKLLVASVTAASVLSGASYLKFAKPLYTSTAHLVVQPPGGLAAAARDHDRTFLNTQCELIRSTPVLAAALADPSTTELRTPGGDDRLASLKRALRAELGDRDDVIRVSLDSPYPKEAADLVNRVVDAYAAEQSVLAPTSPAANDALNGLRQEKAQVDQQLRAARRALTIVQGRPVLPAPTADAAPRLTTVSAALVDARLATRTAKADYEELAGASIDGDAPPAAAPDPGNGSGPRPTREQIRDDLAAARAQLQDVQTYFLPSHPSVLAAQARVDQVRTAYLRVLRDRWAEAYDRERELRKRVDELQAAAEQAQRQHGAVAKHDEALHDARAEVDRLQKRSDDLAVQVAALEAVPGADAVKVTVTDRAVAADRPSRPDRKQTLLESLLLGLLTGGLLAVIREKTDPRLRSVEAVRAAFTVPVLGGVPSMANVVSETARGQKSYLDPASPIAEAYRTVRTAVLLGRPGGRRLRTVLITSPGAEAGKTTLASNLAIVLAQASKRVLLIDADLRSPRLQVLFNVRDRAGLSNLLQPGGRSWEQLIQQTAIAGLHVLPAGPAPRDPAGLLNGDGLVELLGDLADRYDVVLLDAPPVLPVSDARILAASCDGTLLVLRATTADRGSCRAALEGLGSVGANVLGIVVNEVASSEKMEEVPYRDRRRAVEKDDKYDDLTPAPEVEVTTLVDELDSIVKGRKKAGREGSARGPLSSRSRE